MPADPLIGTTLSGRFRLEEQIGRGGMSTVYRAFDAVLERKVAIKVMHHEFSQDEQFLERFRREARAVAPLSHPHIVTVIDAGEDEGHPYIVFEYVPGENLKQRIRKLGALPIAEAIAYAIEIGRALSAAHASNLIHRDIKPQNVLLDEEGRAKVTDFGIARLLGAEGLTQAGRVLGTTDYVSPEQALGHEVTGQSDVYSLGVVLYEMLAGEPPFRGDTQVNTAMKHVKEGFPDIQKRRRKVSAALAAIVEQATAKSTDRRYSTIDEMVGDLERALTYEIARSGQETGEATTVLRSLPAGMAKRGLPLPRRRSRIAILIATALLVVIALVTVGVLASKTDDTTVDRDMSGRSPAQPIPLPAKAARDYDPLPGDNREHQNKIQTVVDGNPQTFWDTEIYKLADFGHKTGVGLLIDVGKPVAARFLSMRSPPDIAGYDAEIYGANPPLPENTKKGWTLLAHKAKVTSKERFELQTTGRKYRYYLIWITRLGGEGPYQAGISEVKLFA